MDAIKYFDFKKFKKGRGKPIPDNSAVLHYVTKANSNVKGNYYCLTFNNKISNEIAERGFNYVRIGENSMTGELFLMFIKEETPDAIKISTQRGNSSLSSISIYSKALMEFLMKRFSIDIQDAASYPLTISDNRSRSSDAIVILISNQ